MINYILNIPNDIFQQHLIQYLDIPEIQNLDHSLQINKLHAKFVDKLLNIILVSSNLSNISTYFMIWLKKRKIKLKHIKFDVHIKNDNQYVLDIMQLCNSTISTVCDTNRNKLIMSELNIHNKIYKELETSIMNYTLIKNKLFIKQIYSINLSGTKINDEFIIYLSKNCKQLLLLDISYCIEIKNNASIIELLKNSCHLISLITKNCVINDECVLTLTNHCKSLEMLDITNCIDITDISIHSIIKNTIKLKSLNIHGCVNISTDSIIKLLQNNNDLIIVDTKYCKNMTNECIIALANHCNQLTYLDISGCLNISELSIVYLVNYCIDLKVLNLTNIHNLTDNIVIQITKGCKTLQSLVLYSSSGYLDITNDSITNGIGMYCNSLKELDLTNCRSINNEGIINLSLTCKYLEILILKGCIHISDYSIKELSKNCLYLQLLNLRCCNNITDISIYELANNSKYLQSLSLRPKNSTLITDESILYLIKHCKQLIELEISNCKITYDVINYIELNCIHIKTLIVCNNNL